MREAPTSRTVTDTDSYAFFREMTNAKEGMTAAYYSMPLKRLTPEIRNFLATRMPLEIPADLAAKAKRLSVIEIYSLQDLNLADYGVYGNHIVIVADEQYIDFDLPLMNSARTIIDLIS